MTSQPDRNPASRRNPAAKDHRPSVVVLGVGQMGLVCAGLLASEPRQGEGPLPDGPIKAVNRPCRVIMWAHSREDAGQLAQTRTSQRLPGFILPDQVHLALQDADALRDAALIVSAIPVQYIRDTWVRLAPHVPANIPVLSVAKGIENRTLLRPTQVIAEVLRDAGRDDPDAPARAVGCLSGPTIAAELARCMPAAMIAASDDPALANQVQSLFGSTWMRVYTHADTLGVELAGAVKNVIAIAAGVLDGLQAGYNAKSALLARGLAEITRLGAAMGASPDTFFGIAGVGDLATTCFSPEGRNRSLGEALGKGQRLDEYLAASPFVVEGVATTRSVLELARKYRVDMPITSAVHAVLFEGVDPVEAIGALMARSPKAERVG